MADAPLPPHERHWRHPSELAQATVVEPSSSRSRVIAFSSGAVAVVLVAFMVVSITPRRSSAPNAISATTIPSASVQLRSVQGVPTAPTVRIERQRVAEVAGMALVGAPSAFARPGDTASGGLPGDDARVMVVTSSYTYDVAWGDVDRLDAPDGSMVITPDGELLAVFDHAELRVLVD